MQLKFYWKTQIKVISQQKPSDTLQLTLELLNSIASK